MLNNVVFVLLIISNFYSEIGYISSKIVQQSNYYGNATHATMLSFCFYKNDLSFYSETLEAITYLYTATDNFISKYYQFAIIVFIAMR